MTTKLNLTNLIERFAERNPQVATRLTNLTKQAEHEEEEINPFKSALLTDEDLKPLVDSLDRKSTIEEFNKVKDAVKDLIESSDKFSPKKKQSGLADLAKISKSEKLQSFFYNYVLAAEGLKTLRVSNLHNVTDSLIEVANRLDLEDPELAKEADQILESLVKEAQMGWAADEADALEDEWDADPEVWEPMQDADLVEVDILDPDLEEPASEPECDEISIQDLQDRVNNMKWRLADKATKQRFEKALEHAHRAKQYLDAHKKYKDVAHSIFDKAGDKLRFKFD